MWKLQPTESGVTTQESLLLLPGQVYVVGRKNCEILLPSDQSISRVHAHLTVTEQTITLKDSSKYGTFINGEKLETGSTRTLQPGDRLTFGVFQSKFRLEKECVVVCSSCVNNEGKVSLSHDVRSIGGRLINSWTPDCTHLVMPTVKVTIKMICALLCCRHIVKPEFFSVFSKAVQQKQPLPKAEGFRPPVDEPTLAKDDVDLSARPERKSLFKGKTFLFLNCKQMKRLSQAVSCGGGVSQLLEEGSLPLSLLEAKSTCVVDMISGNSQAVILPASKKWVESVAQILHRNGLRFITESEIGLAAIHVNNQTYCNPCSSINSESVKAKPDIAAATLSQNTAVDETALAAPSQNITAYVVNTVPSQNLSRMDISGIRAVGETPEKRHTTQRALQGPTVSSKNSRGPEPPAACIITETEMPSESSNKNDPEKKKTSSAPLSKESVVPDGSQRLTAPSSGNSMPKQSPQKQAALTNYFQPVTKKRPREETTSSVQLEAKHSRKDSEKKEDELMKDFGPSNYQQTSSTNRSHRTSHTAQNLRSSVLRSEISASLGLGSCLGLSSDHSVAQQAQSGGSSQISSSKKRKELEQDPGEPAAAADFDMSLEELESIMSDEMDEPLQAAASKKQCLETRPSSTVNNHQLLNQQEGNSIQSTRNQKSSAEFIQHLQMDKTGTATRNQASEKRSERSSNQASDLESDAHTSKRLELEEGKEEEVSFVVASGPQNSLSQHCEAVAKQEMQASTENHPELPRRLLQIRFKSLTVSTSSRSRPTPLQTHDPNGKNVKRFCKTSVPGFKGLPNIIGGTDLVAHNRSKNSELEEWLKQAAEEEKQNERDETLGDDLFRYNPRPARKL
ncbi:nibrin isoform X2 [Xyrauchen texanus]|uniref:nibrin isoform X2 n=1 Tax=Xyrauchen texanus TaxID=154827 RepID=UPI002241E875|nr:nibrin isoform X2 [Xyrauchen texanus]